MLTSLTSSYRRTLVVALLSGSLLVLPAASANAGGQSATTEHASSSAKHKKRGKCSKLHSKKARRKCVAKRREADEGVTAPMSPAAPPVESPVPLPTDPGAVLPG